jgi:hypothetical protein
VALLGLLVRWGGVLVVCGAARYFAVFLVETEGRSGKVSGAYGNRYIRPVVLEHGIRDLCSTRIYDIEVIERLGELA